jgi:hypothetical protein
MSQPTYDPSTAPATAAQVEELKFMLEDVGDRLTLMEAALQATEPRLLRALMAQNEQLQHTLLYERKRIHNLACYLVKHMESDSRHERDAALSAAVRELSEPVPEKGAPGGGLPQC